MNVLILSTQYNRYGGSATCAYELHKYLLKNNINSIVLFFDNTIINKKNMYNQDDLPNVYACKLLKNYLDNNIDLSIYDKIKNIINEQFNFNFIMLGFNYLVPLIGKLLFPNNIMYYMITGSCYINNNNIITSNKLINDNFTQEYNQIEKKSIEISNYVIPNSVIMKNVIKSIYGITINEIYDLHEIYEDNDLNNKYLSSVLLNNSIIKRDYTKKYDIIFISSNFDRGVKNIDLVQKILSNENIKNLKKIVVGKNSNKYFNDTKYSNLIAMDLINQEQITQLLRQCKIILIPSLIESYSISCIEASNNACIPLLSINVGCNNFVNDYFIIKTYNVEDWIKKINEISNNYIYYKNIFFNNYTSGNKILDMISKQVNTNNKKKVLFVTVDIPGNGGAATNTMNLINNLKNLWDIYTIFIDDNTEHVIEGLDNYLIIKNDTDIINNLIKFKNITQINFDFIFCKNYKSVILIKNVFKKSNIIYSPSGLRYIVSMIDKEYINNIKLQNNDIINNYTHKNSVMKFIRNNDNYLDFLAYNYSNIIIPNSKITFDLINKIYDEKKINQPIYTTNINFNKSSIDNTNFKEREYDIMFCCYSWSRACKNLNLVIDLCKLLQEYKILLIGKNVDINLIEHNNIYYIDNIPNHKINEYMKKSKIIVIPSFFDSNPNVLIEGVIAGCNIVTSNNIGNYEFLNKNQIVVNPNNINEWIQKIILCLNTKYDYMGFEGKEIINNLMKITQNIDAIKMMVGIYKVNPLWDNNNIPNFNYFTFSIKKNDKFIQEIVYYDIYFILTYKIGISNKCNDINYIIVDETIDDNECYYVYNSINYIEDFVKIWKIKSRADLFYFNESDIYFLRGNYHKLYEIFIPENSKVIFYPATSFKQNTKISNIKPFKNKYDIVLIHEDPRYNKFYQDNNCVFFKKFTPNNFVNLNLNRVYDLCFVAVETQSTKNHHLFLNFLDYLEDNNYNYNIVYVGDLTHITNGNVNYADKFINIKLEYYNKLTREELVIIYNKSKNNIIFSGRDCFPRSICESLACGCFNIIFNTINDGKSICDGVLGVGIGNKNIPFEYINSSLSYKPDKRLWDTIIQHISKSKNHDLISTKYKKEYNIENLLNSINSILQNTTINYTNNNIVYNDIVNNDNVNIDIVNIDIDKNIIKYENENTNIEISTH
jgi:hypothetical protein